MKYKIKNNLILEKKNNKITIFDPDKSAIYQLNKSAAYILDRIEKKLEKNQIIRDITTKYRINKINAKKELDKTIRKLVKIGIIS